MEEVEISKMTLEDFEQIKAILMSDFDDFWTVEMLKTEMVAENREYVVAKKNKGIVGFAGVLHNFPELEIMNIVTKKTNRHNSIGTKMLEEIVKNAKINHFEKIFLEVNEKNKIAKKLYEKLGFVSVGKRKNYYKNENAVVMAKNLL